MIIVKCKNCQKDFQKYPSQTKAFCSKECRAEYKKKQIPTKEFVCEQCGKSFIRTMREVKNAEKRGNKIRFCSKQCKSDFRGRNRIKAICPVCGKEFLKQKQLEEINNCCSPECSAKNPSNRRLQGNVVKKICEHCHQEYYIKESVIRKQVKAGQNIRFCSRDCAQAHLQRNNFESSCTYCGKKLNLPNKVKGRSDKYFCDATCREKYLARGRVEKQCPKCGEIFIVPASKSDRTYCSEKCRVSSMKKDNKILSCINCGKEFEATKYQADHGRKFCCQDCRRTYQHKEKETYEDVSHYLRTTTDYSSWRDTIFKRANYTCEKCGDTKSRLHAHHINLLHNICKKYDFYIDKILHSKEFHDTKNGICLCEECHSKEHPYDKRLRNNKGQFMPS